MTDAEPPQPIISPWLHREVVAYVPGCTCTRCVGYLLGCHDTYADCERIAREVAPSMVANCIAARRKEVCGE